MIDCRIEDLQECNPLVLHGSVSPWFIEASFPLMQKSLSTGEQTERYQMTCGEENVSKDEHKQDNTKKGLYWKLQVNK